LSRIVAKLREMADETPSDPSLQPAALLVQLADSDQTFAQWQKSRAAG
jgi:3-hydroxyacyl-CoA dehydrogenase